VFVGLDCLLLKFSLLRRRPKSSIIHLSTYFFCPPPDQHTQSIYVPLLVFITGYFTWHHQWPQKLSF